jgi:hypothetical protein
MALELFTLDKFKLEVGNNFDEHHLENILYELYNDEKLYIKTSNSIIIDNVEYPCNSFKLGILSDDGKFSIKHHIDSIDIYTLNTIGKFNSYLYLTIGNIPVNNKIIRVQMYKNIVYVLTDRNVLLVFDIVNKTVSQIFTDVGIFYVYKGIVCIRKNTLITIYNLDGSKCEILIDTEYFKENYGDGLLYLHTRNNKIHVINIETNKVEIINNPLGYQKVIYTNHGQVCISKDFRTLILPSGKTIKFADFVISNISTNKLNNILICTLFNIYLNNVRILVINLETEITISDSQGLGQMSVSGFLTQHTAEVTETIELDYKDFKGL